MTIAQDRRLELVLDFLNTVDVEAGTDELRDVAAFRAWLHDRELPDRSDLAAARQFRAWLRAAIGDAPDEDAGEPTGVPVTVGLDADGRPTLRSPDALGRIAAAAVGLVDDGRWDRVKICRADDCRWAFFDRSKNHSRHWCSMGECGNRAKSRAFRQRLRRSASTD